MKESLERIFLAIILFAMMILGYNYYGDYIFERDFEKRYLPSLQKKEMEILQNMQHHFGYAARFPIIITDKIPGRIYGLATFDKQKHVVIYLNKRIFKESFDYILDDVLAHEYAHALLLNRGYVDDTDGGHTVLWQRTCKALGGIHCERYVDRDDIVDRKLQKILVGHFYIPHPKKVEI